MKLDIEYFKNNFFGYSKEKFPVSFTEKRSLKSCDRCIGTGRTSREELSDYHKREYNIYHEECKNCAGEGRVIVTDIYVSFGDIPYNYTKKTSNFSQIPYETFEEPYTKEGAEKIEHQSQGKTFWFNLKDVED
jgi:hypothetical protein